jgi:hypothetical protein
MFGLGVFFILFLAAFLLKLWKFAGGGSAASPAARADAAVAAARSDFDADLAFERYMARRNAPPPDRPLTFGRKSG